MYRILDKRGSGKTSRLMLLAKENKGVIVCSNPYAMREKAYDYGITGVDFISYLDLINGEYDRTKPVFLDEAEIFIKLFANNILGYTMSLED